MIKHCGRYLQLWPQRDTSEAYFHLGSHISRMHIWLWHSPVVNLPREFVGYLWLDITCFSEMAPESTNQPALINNSLRFSLENFWIMGMKMVDLYWNLAGTNGISGQQNDILTVELLKTQNPKSSNCPFCPMSSIGHQAERVRTESRYRTDWGCHDWLERIPWQSNNNGSNDMLDKPHEILTGHGHKHTTGMVRMERNWDLLKAPNECKFGIQRTVIDSKTWSWYGNGWGIANNLHISHIRVSAVQKLNSAKPGRMTSKNLRKNIEIRAVVLPSSSLQCISIVFPWNNLL